MTQPFDLINRATATEAVQQRFSDPVATRTEWSPLSIMTTSFRTHGLVREHAGRVALKLTSEARSFWIMMGLVTAAPFIIIGTIFHRVGFISDMMPMLALKLSAGFLAFPAVMGFFFYKGAVPMVFDKPRGLFWKGWGEPRTADGIDLNDIYALQLIPSRGRRRNLRYELNLVLKDASRINLIAHSDRAGAFDDGQALAEFLRRPLWDATAQTLWVNVHGG